MTHELQILRAEVKSRAISKVNDRSPPEKIVSSTPISTEKVPSPSTTGLEKNIDIANSRIKELELEVSHLNEDLKMTILRQKETGASANEALLQLESEIEKFVFFWHYSLTMILTEIYAILDYEK